MKLRVFYVDGRDEYNEHARFVVDGGGNLLVWQEGALVATYACGHWHRVAAS